MTALHLWETTHPYSCEPGNYYLPGAEGQTSYDSWSEFLEEWPDGGWDEDFNVVFRWDWERYDPEDLEEDDPAEVLHLFWVGQRKASRWSSHITVTEADEPQVRDWLRGRAEYMTRLWSPFTDLRTPGGGN